MTILKKQAIVGTLTTIVLLALMFGVNVITSQAAETSKQVIITFEKGKNDSAMEALQNKGQVLKKLPLVNGVVMKVPEQAIPALSAIPGIKSIEEDVRVFALKPLPPCVPWPACKSASQPGEVLEWDIDRIGANLAWSTSTGANVAVAIIDTGIDKDHTDLISNIKGGVNFVLTSTKPPKSNVVDPSKWDDDNGHGTHVAGTVAARDNEIGVVGVAPEASLYAVKVLDSTGSGYVSNVISGITWAIENNMDVINMSLGVPSDVQVLHNAVDAAYAAGIVVVAAAGNSGDGNATTNNVNYPAKYSSVIAVSATDSNNTVPSWSSDGAEVEIAAPGVSIRSTWNDGLYNTISGTSMASPHVAGTVALILTTAIPTTYDVDNDGAWDPAEVRAVLQATANDFGTPGHDNFYGYGLIDASESVLGN